MCSTTKAFTAVLACGSLGLFQQLLWFLNLVFCYKLISAFYNAYPVPQNTLFLLVMLLVVQENKKKTKCFRKLPLKCPLVWVQVDLYSCFFATRLVQLENPVY